MISAATLEDANAALGLRLRQQELAAAFAGSSLDAEALQPVLDEACRVAAAGMACSLAKVLEFLPGEDCFIMRAGIGWHPGTVGHARLGSDGESPAGHAFRTGQPVLSNELGSETRFRTPALLVEHGVRRAFNVLVCLADQRFGVLEVDSPDGRAFSPQDAAFLQTLAATLAQAIARQRRLAELQERRAFAQGVLDASPDCVKVIAADGTIRFMSHKGLEVNAFGALADLQGRPFLELWPAAERERIGAAMRRAAGGEVARVCDVRRSVGERPRWWDVGLAPLPGADADGAVIAISHDVSEQHATAEALRRSEAQLRALNGTLESRVAQRTRERDRLWALSEDLLVVADYDGTLLRLSPSWTRLLGHDEATLLRRPYFELIHPEDLDDVRARLARMRVDGLPAHYANRVHAADGGWRWVAWTLSPEPGEERLLGVGRDITAEREEAALRGRLEEQLRQSQKMEAVGQLTGGLAHDFNNLLTGITGSLELLETRISQGRLNDAQRYIAAAQGTAKRAAALTHRLLAFSRRQTLEPRPVEGDRLLAGLGELIGRTVGPAVAVETISAPGLWTVLCDPNQLENALLNLCINGRDAMSGGGRLVIRLANVEVEEGFAMLRDMPTGQFVALSVTDTGSGMAPEVLARAFEPFFTTKPVGQGTGLGLAMVYGFARQSGGQVRIHSVEGSGTTVSLYLPRHRGEASEPMGRLLVDARQAGAGETVLVVDDEATVRMLVVEVLQELGYTAIEAADGASGLRVLQSDVRVDLLVTDVGLPGGMNGRQMADAGRLSRPGLRVLFITGYAEGTVVGEAALPEGMQVMTKPFGMEALATRIGGIIRGR